MRMRRWWDERVWSSGESRDRSESTQRNNQRDASELPMGGGEPGMGMENRTRSDDAGEPGPRRSREVEGGADIGGSADPGKISGRVSYVNEPPENIVGRVGGGGGPVPLTEGGDFSTGPSSEGGSDTGPSGGEQAGGASNTGGVAGDASEGM